MTSPLWVSHVLDLAELYDTALDDTELDGMYSWWGMTWCSHGHTIPTMHTIQFWPIKSHAIYIQKKTLCHTFQFHLKANNETHNSDPQNENMHTWLASYSLSVVNFYKTTVLHRGSCITDCC